ncbi:protein FAM163B [Protopterus annectens]|uniref:protein FAM163B n=1 Tax=Protopterus annectens TaxID=7888 RepID=UPI001CF93A61|nr:protein FAM163B [Protopterus annectens]XP_043914377.1 protein FAM163B [Protopterus annectens]XP_043914378.1 protein FAM163B [Protopterus annectens]XP_043914379.1 protein FAM163B [Protopterus annectens]XP_043914380.1 protein FAM163B [Protopterus annectens]XP_043914381.1 protein FAM163B [Protopterus annectens]
MTAGTVVITGGILATVILLCIIAVLCYCRLQYYCCKKEDSDEDEEEPDFAVHSHLPSSHYNHNVVSTNGPSPYTSSFSKKHSQSRTVCPSCTHYDLPFIVHPPEEIRNGGDRISYKTVTQEELELPVNVTSLQPVDHNRLSAMREAFSRSRSISTDV